VQVFCQRCHIILSHITSSYHISHHPISYHIILSHITSSYLISRMLLGGLRSRTHSEAQNVFFTHSEAQNVFSTSCGAECVQHILWRRMCSAHPVAQNVFYDALSRVGLLDWWAVWGVCLEHILGRLFGRLRTCIHTTGVFWPFTLAVCMHAVYACMHAVYACMHAVYACMHAVYACMHACCVCMYAYTLTHAYIHTYTRIHTHLYAHKDTHHIMCTRAHIDTCTSSCTTYTRKYMYRCIDIDI